MMLTKILALSTLVIIFSSCDSNKETILIQNIEESLLSDYKSRLSSIKILHKQEFEIKPSLYKAIISLDSAFLSTRESIEKLASTEHQSSVDAYISFCKALTDNDQVLKFKENKLPESNSSIYAKIQVNMLTHELIGNLAADIGSEDIMFNVLRTVVELDKPSVKLGESISGTMFLAATSTATNRKTVFLINGDTIKTNQYKADFSFKPKSRGTEKLNFQIKSNGKSWLSNTEFADKVLEVKVN